MVVGTAARWTITRVTVRTQRQLSYRLALKVANVVAVGSLDMVADVDKAAGLVAVPEGSVDPRTLAKAIQGSNRPVQMMHACGMSGMLLSIGAGRAVVGKTT